MVDCSLPIKLLAHSVASQQKLIPRLSLFNPVGDVFYAPKIWSILLVLVLALPTCAQEFVPEQVVFPITDFKPDVKHLAVLSVKFGTGFCLDQGCRFVGTNYHVAQIIGRHVRIKGVFSVNWYLDSSPGEAGAEDVNLASGSSLRYAPAHDLAIYEMRHRLKNFHGVGFDCDELDTSSEVDIYAYPLKWNPKRRLVRWHGKFIGKTQHGLLAFSYQEGRVKGGASGGIVVNSKTKKIIGILNGMGESSEPIALAVPAKEMSDFVTRAQPYLQESLFPKTVFVSPVARDLYPAYVPQHDETLLKRPFETPSVLKVRRTAQRLADSMRNFTAIETLAWGHDNDEPEVTDAYETLMLDGWQRWRRPGDHRLYDQIPFPPLNRSILPGAEWSYLPEMVGTNFSLKVRQAPDAIMGGQNIHVFQYAANADDEVCTFRSVINFELFRHDSTKFYNCHGEVWVDDLGTILRISEALDLSGPWYRWWGVMTYGWVEKNGSRYLVPVTIATQAEHNNTYWCRGLFTDYDMFSVKTRLLMPTSSEPSQEFAFRAH